MMAQKSQWQDLKATGHIMSAVRGRGGRKGEQWIHVAAQFPESLPRE